VVRLSPYAGAGQAAFTCNEQMTKHRSFTDPCRIDFQFSYLQTSL